MAWPKFTHSDDSVQYSCTTAAAGRQFSNFLFVVLYFIGLRFGFAKNALRGGGLELGALAQA